MTTLLLVDDDPNMRIMWSRMLEPMSAELLMASSVEEAIIQMRRIPPPDLVLLDLKLDPFPAEHTVKSIQKLRGFNPNLIVIVISGMTEDDIARTIRGAQVERWMTKTESLTQKRLLEVVLSELNVSRGISDSTALLGQIDRLMQR